MEYNDGLKIMFDEGMNSFWRTVKAMPEDKLTWQPEPSARSARQLAEEVVSIMPYSTEFIKTQKQPSFQEDGSLATLTLDQLEEKHREYIKQFIEAVKSFPAEDLKKVNELPWGKMTFFDIITYPYWNMIYHWGQISYLQTMYGDKETH